MTDVINITKSVELNRTFEQLLSRYYHNQDESVLLEFYELGKQMNQAGLAPELAVETYALANEKLAPHRPQLGETTKVVPLIETIMAYGVTFRQRLHWQEEQSNQQFLSVLEQSSDLVFICNNVPEVTYANPAFCQRMASDQIGQPAPLFKDEKQPGAVVQLWSTLLQGGEWQGKLLLTVNQNHYRHIRLKAFPLASDKSASPLFVFMAEDIEKQVALEAKMQQSQRLSTLGEVASSISHEFNNILLIISGFAELIKDEPSGGAQSEFADEILCAVAKSSRLISQILSLACEKNHGRKQQQLVPMVKNIASMLTTIIGSDIKLTLSYSELARAVKTHISEDHLCQILTNLAINARHAIQSLGIKGQIDVDFSINAAQKTLSVNFTDNGGGISPSIQQHIFEPFFSTKEVGHGSGLGLSIVLKLVDHYQGDIQVESEQGCGTRFTLDFPLPDYLSDDQVEHTVAAHSTRYTQTPNPKEI